MKYKSLPFYTSVKVLKIMENEKKEFTGIWTPVEVLELENVTGNEMLLLSYIIGLDNDSRGCYASNKHLAKRLKLSRGRISEMISSLLTKGLITYQLFQEEGNKRVIYSNLYTSTGKPDNPIRENLYTSTGKPDNPIRENPKHNNKVYSKEERKVERELSHFEFFKISFPEDYEKWKNENEKKIFDKLGFMDAFNNKMELENFPKNKKIIPRCKDYARNWIRNQKEEDRPQSRPPYMRTIT